MLWCPFLFGVVGHRSPVEDPGSAIFVSMGRLNQAGESPA